ncbi:MAG: hypothetical protein VW226_04655 [Rhodospirillaceae bacterium]|jgi:heme A synthase
MQIPRYVTGAILFALIWAAIAYVNGGIRDFRVLAIGVIAFIILGSLLSWALTKLFTWYKKRR